MEAIINFVYNLSHIDFLINISLIVSIGWFVSHYAKNTIPRLLFICFGFYLIFQYPSTHTFFYLGIGFIIAHLIFLYYYVQIQYSIFKEASINSYYLMLTIYGKILSFFRWIVSIFEAIKIFIKTKSFSSAKSSYTDENKQEEYKSSSYHNSYSDSQRNSSFRGSNQGNKEQTRDKHEEQQEKQSNHQKTEQKVYISNPTRNKEFDQFFSSSKYEVLGANSNMTYQEINKLYRALVKKFHPDVGTIKDETGLVIKRINSAFDCFKAHKKAISNHKCEFCNGYKG